MPASLKQPPGATPPDTWDGKLDRWCVPLACCFCARAALTSVFCALFFFARLDTVNARAEAVLARTGLLNTLALPLSSQEKLAAGASRSAGGAVPPLHLPRPTPRPRGGATSSSPVPAWALQPAAGARAGGGNSKGRGGAVGGVSAPGGGAGGPFPAATHRRGDVIPGVRVCCTFGLRLNAHGELCIKPQVFTATAGPLTTVTETLPPWVAPLGACAHGAFTWVTRACSSLATGVGRTLLGVLQDALSDNAAEGATAKRVDGAAAAGAAHGREQGAVRSSTAGRARSAPAEQADEEVESAPAAPRGRHNTAPPQAAWSPASGVSASDDTSPMTEDFFPPARPPPSQQPRVSAAGASTDDESAAAAAHALVASLLAGTSDDLATLEFSAANRRAARSNLGGGVSGTPSSSSVFINGGGIGMQTPGDTPLGPGMANLVSAVAGPFGATSEDALREAARIELGRLREGGGDDMDRMAAEQAWSTHDDMVPTPEGTPMPPHHRHLTVEEQREVWTHNREAATHAAARRYSGGGDASAGGGQSPSSPSYGRTSVLHIR
jgi:hypothetical protein